MKFSYQMLSIGVLLCFSLAGCDSNQQKVPDKVEAAKVSVRIPWIRTAATVGLEVAYEKGFFKDNGLNVDIHPGSIEASPLKKVLIGEDQFGILEPAQVVMGIAKQNMPLVILAVKMQKSPFCLMSRKEDGIASIKDIEGRRVGYNPLNDVSYLAMLKAGGVDRANIHEIRVQFSLQPFLQKQVDVWPSYISNEPIAVKNLGISTSLICADDIGVHLYEHALFAREDFVKKHPKTVRAFVQSWVAGWNYSIQHPEKAVQILLQRVQSLEQKHELQTLRTLIPLMTTGKAKTQGFAWVDQDMIREVSNTLLSLGFISEQPPLSRIVDNHFLKEINRRESD